MHGVMGGSWLGSKWGHSMGPLGLLLLHKASAEATNQSQTGGLDTFSDHSPLEQTRLLHSRHMGIPTLRIYQPA